MDISAHKLAELIAGIARAQAALINGIESAMPGARGTHIVPALQNVAHLLDHPDPTLMDLPARVLLSSLGRASPDPDPIARDIERLFSGAAAAPAAAPGAAPPMQGDAGKLGFSKRPD